jgi:hypothetical protein
MKPAQVLLDPGFLAAVSTGPIMSQESVQSRDVVPTSRQHAFDEAPLGIRGVGGPDRIPRDIGDQRIAEPSSPGHGR